MTKLRRDDGVEVFYEVRGSGPAILLSHGMGVTSQMWQHQFDVLSKDHTLVVWDMRGHGRSDAPNDPELYTEAATVSDMAAILDAVGAEQAVVGGLSLGGYMSLAFHRDHGDRCRALLLFDCGPGYRSDAPRDRWNEWAEQSAERYFDRDIADVNADEERMGRQSSVVGLMHAARGMLTQRDGSVMESLSSISAQTLILHGDHDENFVQAMEYMRQKIQNSYKFVAPGSGHYPNIDHPDLVNAALRWFLDMLASGDAPNWVGQGAPRRQR